MTETTELEIAVKRRCAQALVARARLATSDESGVVLILVAILLVALIGSAAIAIDIGGWYAAQQKAQSAADAGALAAAGDLAFTSSRATADGTTIATTNAPGASVGVTTGYDSVPSQVKVAIGGRAPVIFGQILNGGHSSVAIAASAVAEGSIVSDGRFNTPNICIGSGSSWGCNVAAGATVGPWRVTRGSVDAMECNWYQSGQPPNILYIAQPPGDPCNATPNEPQSDWTDGPTSTWTMDLNGSWRGCNSGGTRCTIAPEATIDQTLPTVAGRYYVLSFELSDNPTLGPQPSPDDFNKVQVGIVDTSTGASDVSSGTTQTFTSPTEIEPKPNTWIQETVPFTAASATTTISFTSLDGNSCNTSHVSCPANAGPTITDVQTLPSLVR